jgi:hypothetical protein
VGKVTHNYCTLPLFVQRRLETWKKNCRNKKEGVKKIPQKIQFAGRALHCTEEPQVRKGGKKHGNTSKIDEGGGEKNIRCVRKLPFFALVPTL